MQGHLLPMSGYVDANNHILNTDLAWIFSKLINSNPAILRLPNFLFFPVYFFYSLKITQKIENRFVRLTVFLGLIMTHSLFDFFGLCRGYGMSIALLIVSCFHLIRYFADGKLKDIVLVLFSSLLMVWANLSLLGTAYIFFAVIFVSQLISNNKTNKKILFSVITVISFGFILSFATWYAIHLRNIGKLYLGEEDGGFIKTTALTLIDILFRTKSIYIFILASIYTLLIISVSFLDLTKKGVAGYLKEPLNLFALLFMGNISIIYVSHWFLGVVFPTERAGIYLFPVLLISLGFAADKFLVTFGRKATIYLVSPLLLIPLHFVFSMNLDYAGAYRWESYPERYIRYIQKNAGLCDVYPIIGIYDEDRWVYDNFRHNGQIPFISQNTYPDTIADFQIGKFGDNPYWRNLYDSLDYDSRNDFLLLKRKIFLKRTPVIHYENLSTNGMINDEYFGFAPGIVNDSLLGTQFLYYYDLIITCRQPEFEATIISSIRDSQIYELITLSRVAETWNSRRLKAGVIVRERSATPKIPFAYLWNGQKVPFAIEKGSLTIYRIE